jgi:hypothetical protein
VLKGGASCAFCGRPDGNPCPTIIWRKIPTEVCTLRKAITLQTPNNSDCVPDKKTRNHKVNEIAECHPGKIPEIWPEYGPPRECDHEDVKERIACQHECQD